MAPSKRAENKKGICIYVDEKIVERFRRAADFFGSHMSTLITTFMLKKAEEYEAIAQGISEAQSENETDKRRNAHRNHIKNETARKNLMST